MTRVVITPTRHSHRETETCLSNPNSVRSLASHKKKLDSPFADRMHPNANLLPLQRAASNEDYHYGQFNMSPASHITAPLPFRLLRSRRSTWSASIGCWSRIWLRHARYVLAALHLDGVTQYVFQVVEVI